MPSLIHPSIQKIRLWRISFKKWIPVSEFLPVWNELLFISLSCALPISTYTVTSVDYMSQWIWLVLAAPTDLLWNPILPNQIHNWQVFLLYLA